MIVVVAGMIISIERGFLKNIITHNLKPVRAIECKLTDSNIDPSLSYFKKKFPDVDALQVCLNSKSEFRNANGIRLVAALSFLQELV